MDSSTNDGGVLTASEYLLRETLAEADAELRSRRPCTYAAAPDGLKRLGVRGMTQQIFSCRTCAITKGAPVGVCEPCSLRCHAEHELEELETRTQFTCDCPTERSDVTCGAQPVPIDNGQKTLPADPANVYNHNFVGRYCKCNRPYDRGMTMHGCGRCSDWFHPYCLPGCLPYKAIPFQSLLCPDCLDAVPSLGRLRRYVKGVCSVAVVRSHGTGALAEQQEQDNHPTGTDDTSASTVPSGTAPHDPSALSASADDAAQAALQPWRVCLTCTNGADDGRGVCMACAESCHAGHVLGKPRTTGFVCDCDELKQGAGGCCVPTAPAGAEVPNVFARWCAAQEPVDGMLAASSTAASGSSVTLEVGVAAGASVYWGQDDEDLPDRMCGCDACLAVYARDGIAPLFFQQQMMQLDAAPVAVGGGASGSGEVLDGDTAAAVTKLLERLEDRHAATSTASAAPGEDDDALAEKAGRAISALQRAGFKTSYERSMGVLQQMPASQQRDAMAAYARLQSHVFDFLNGFQASGKVITKEDVEAFNAQLLRERRDAASDGSGDDGRRVRPRPSGWDGGE